MTQNVLAVDIVDFFGSFPIPGRIWRIEEEEVLSTD